jgi:hypothetical protein
LAAAPAGAIFVRRAFAINRDAFQSGMRAAGVPTVGALGLDTRQASGAADAGGVPYPASEADAKALAELDERAAADKQALLSWSLDAWTLEDAEVARLFSSMMHALNLLRRFRISPTAFEAFMTDVACRYNSNPCVPLPPPPPRASMRGALALPFLLAAPFGSVLCALPCVRADSPGRALRSLRTPLIAQLPQFQACFHGDAHVLAVHHGRRVAAAAADAGDRLSGASAG